jgi:dienelactone hydrolase
MNRQPLPAQLVLLDSQVLPIDEAASAPRMLRNDLSVRLRDANQQDADSVYQVRWQQAWEQLRDARLEALRKSMGTPPTTPPQIETTGSIRGEGFRIEKLVVSGRPGLPIAAHLYLPEPLRANMPAMLICSSHHNPKYQGELQDMGMTWARAGCLVLVPETIGHGERRQQPFGMREDYHSRYTIGVQLQLVGQSLAGWMVADLQRCLDVLLIRPDVDAKRIILMGAVAGGGDPAAIATALDPRVTCSIPFNFGAGSQVQWPGIEPFFRWDGYGDWESTRCLRNSGRDLFFPWVIVASAAPRRLIFAKEFAYDAAKDPAYKRIQGIYESYGAGDRISEIHGFGSGSVPAPGASHCNNVGPYHRKQLYPLLQKWFDMPVPEEYQHRLPLEALACMTPQVEAKFGVRPLHEVARDIASRQLAEARKTLADLTPTQRRQKLRQDWANLLGDIEPHPPAAVRQFGLASGTTAWPKGMTICSAVIETSQPADFRPEKVLLTVAPRIDVPVLMLLPGCVAQVAASQPRSAATRPSDLTAQNSVLSTQHSEIIRRPVVICIAQQGKSEFLARRAGEIAQLLSQGITVCLPDLRGMGETSPGPARVYTSEVTEISTENLKLGQPLLGSRLRDLRSVIRYLATRGDIDASRLAIWGDSFGPANPSEFVDPPLATTLPPPQAEPAGAILAILAGLFEHNIKAVLGRGCLTSYAAILDAPAFYVPHDAIVPGAIEVGDLSDLAAALAPMPLRLEAFVDGRNRPAGADAVTAAFAPARQSYAASPAALLLPVAQQPDAGTWLGRILVGD